MPVVDIPNVGPVEFPDSMSESDINDAAKRLYTEAQSKSAPVSDGSGGGPTAVITGARGVLASPGLVQPAARFVANHPRAAQRVIALGARTVSAGIGHATGLPEGGVVGALVSNGLTPTQAGIRETAGRLAGETPAAAAAAGKAQSVIEYAKPLGYRLTPGDLAATPETETQVKKFAESAGQKVIQLFGPEGTIVNGGKDVVGARFAPGPMVRVAAKNTGPRALSKVLNGANVISRVLAPLQGVAAVGDLAQMADPTRRDIGVLGVGRSLPQPTVEEGLKASAEAQKRVDAENQLKMQQRAALLKMLYLRR